MSTMDYEWLMMSPFESRTSGSEACLPFSSLFLITHPNMYPFLCKFWMFLKFSLSPLPSRLIVLINPPVRSTRDSFICPPCNLCYPPFSLAYAFSRSETHTSFLFLHLAKQHSSLSLSHGSNVSMIICCHDPFTKNWQVTNPNSN